MNIIICMQEKRPHSQRFCDVTVTVTFYCKCDVAKSFRMGPIDGGGDGHADMTEHMGFFSKGGVV